jgi:4-amino-4-deoxy-L-arabinose transferase-like glycosyltransferase
MKVILFAASFVLVALAAAEQLKMLLLSSTIEKILALIILGSANIILSTYILSEFSLISMSGYLVIHTCFALASWGIQSKWGKGIKQTDGEVKKDSSSSPGRYVIPKGILMVFFIIILISALVNLFLCLYVPPNNVDSMTYHMSRVGYWHQYGSLHHYYTHKWTQNVLPPNAEILILWTVTFLKSDLLANMIQWIAYCGIGLTIYLIARILGQSQRTSILASLIYLSLPITILESSTTQNDLLVTFFTLNFFYFFHSGLRQKKQRKLFLSGMAIGLAVGAKYTIFYILPALGIASLILLRIYRAKTFLYVRWCVFCLVGILMLGSYNYFQNLKTYGNPMGPSKMIEHFSGKKSLEKIFLNAIRFGYDACDFRGPGPPLESYLFYLKEYFGKQFLNNKKINEQYVNSPANSPFSYKAKRLYHEDNAWLGILGFFLYFPIGAWFFSRILYKFKSAIDERWIYAFIAVFFFIFICLMQNYYPWFGRYFILPMAFIAPIAVAFTSSKNKKLVTAAVVIISLLGTISSLNITLNNWRKPLLPVQQKYSTVHVLNANYYQKRSGVTSNRMVPLLQFIEKVTQPGDRIGHVCNLTDWDYSFFGRGFSREVIPIKRYLLKRGKSRVMEENELDYLIISIDKSKALTSTDLVLPSSMPNQFFRIISKANKKGK